MDIQNDDGDDGPHHVDDQREMVDLFVFGQEHHEGQIGAEIAQLEGELHHVQLCRGGEHLAELHHECPGQGEHQQIPRLVGFVFEQKVEQDDDQYDARHPRDMHGRKARQHDVHVAEKMLGYVYGQGNVDHADENGDQLHHFPIGPGQLFSVLVGQEHQGHQLTETREPEEYGAEAFIGQKRLEIRGKHANGLQARLPGSREIWYILIEANYVDQSHGQAEKARDPLEMPILPEHRYGQDREAYEIHPAKDGVELVAVQLGQVVGAEGAHKEVGQEHVDHGQHQEQNRVDADHATEQLFSLSFFLPDQSKGQQDQKDECQCKYGVKHDADLPSNDRKMRFSHYSTAQSGSQVEGDFLNSIKAFFNSIKFFGGWKGGHPAGRKGTPCGVPFVR